MIDYLQPDYFKKLFYDQKYIILFLFLFGLSFQFLWVSLLFESDIGTFIGAYAELLPPFIMNMIGVKTGSEMFFAQMTAFGYAHPLVLMALAFLPVSIPARYIAGEIENKTFDILLTKPIDRGLIVVQLFLFLVLCFLLLFVGFFSGTFLGSWIFNVSLQLSVFVEICLAGFCFYLSMAAISLAVAVFNRERGKTLTYIISIMVVLYFYDTIIRAASSLEYLVSYSYFQLYQPVKYVMEEINIGNSVLISLLITVIFFIISLLKFNRRDL
ncbi:MAG: ABC transporter permease subunit [Calditrichaceae bacterium]|nr:ABC transporter permease subunit [Calditrichaceae bacterium]MBN2708541.1 ABC transporter permease subunit [Calditrichaceae bacterium]RQV93496.1 MAG: hypothetical protein EH224_12425 [Calditrichota bacterium]